MTNVDTKPEYATRVASATAPITGTPHTLHYGSDRTPGNGAAKTVSIPISGGEIPDTVKRIHLKITVAGQKHEFEYPPDPNQTHTFEWDGKDGYGRPVSGRCPLRIRVGYVYDAVYATPAEAERTFARFAEPDEDHFTSRITGSPSRDELTLWSDTETRVGATDARTRGTGGWSLGVHHRYSPGRQSLELGWGRDREAATIPREITTVAGGQQGFRPDDVTPGEPATETPLYQPQRVVVDADGVFYVPDPRNHRVYAVGEDGLLTVVAGTGTRGFDGDGGPATDAEFDGPNDVAIGPDGSLYVSDGGNGRIRRIDPEGVVETVAGGGTVSVSRVTIGGDAVQATDAQLIITDNVTVGADGLVTFETISGAVLLRIEADGTLAHVFGAPGFDSPREQGVLATRYDNWTIVDTDVGPDGALYVADGNVNSDDRIVRVRASDGVVETVVGGGDRQLEPGLSASEVRLAGNSLQSVAVGPDGRVYFAVNPMSARASNPTPTDRRQVFVVGDDGFLTPVAGRHPDQLDRDPGDGGPAIQARLVSPTGIDISPDGGVYVADRADGRIRLVRPVALPGVAAGNVLVAAASGDEIYEFDQGGYHLRTLNALTGATRYRFRYTETGRLAAVEDGDGNTTRFLRDSDGTFTGIVSPDGVLTTVELDGAGYLRAIANPAGETTRLTYDGGGLLTSVTDPDGNTERFEYDDGGRLAAVIDPTGERTRLTTTDTEDGQTVTVTSPESRETTYLAQQPGDGIDARITRRTAVDGHLERSSDGTFRASAPDGTTLTGVEAGDPRFGMQAPRASSMTLGTPGGIDSTVETSQTVELAGEDPTDIREFLSELTVNGATTTAAYDSATRTMTTTSPVGRVNRTSLDEQGRPLTDQTGNTTPIRFEYDERGRPVEIIQDDGTTARTTAIEYDSNGYPSSTTDSLGNVTAFTYDSAGRLTERFEPTGETTEFEYDAAGMLTAIVTPAGHRHEMDRDAAGRIVSSRPPPVNSQTGATTYTYDGDGLLISLDRPSGTIVRYRYDRHGRPTSIDLAGSRVEFAYDGTTGEVASVEAPDVDVAFDRDGPLLTGITLTGDIEGTLGFAHDENMQVVQTTVDGGHAVAIDRDQDGLPTRVGAYSLARDGATGLVAGGRVGGIADAWDRDSFDRVTEFRSTHGGRTVYEAQTEYDPLDRVTDLVETVDGSRTAATFEYDGSGRLVAATRDGDRTTFSYDANGNRTREQGPGGTTTASYDARDRPTAFGNATFAYSPDDERIRRTEGGATTRYEYDARSNLTGVDLPDGTRIEYVYDGLNNRVGKRVDGRLRSGLLFRAAGGPLAELDAGGSVRSRFVYATGRRAPDYLVQSGRTYRLLTDAFGSVRLVVDAATGSVAQRLDYDALGRVSRDTNPGFQPFGYIGGLYDPDTGLVHVNGRDYDAETGRFLVA